MEASDQTSENLKETIVEILLNFYQETNPGLLADIQKIAALAPSIQDGEAFIQKICPVNVSTVTQNHLLVLLEHFFKHYHKNAGAP